MNKPPQVVIVYAEERGDSSVALWRDDQRSCLLVTYPKDCVDIPSRKYTLFVKLPTSCRWALKWLN